MCLFGGKDKEMNLCPLKEGFCYCKIHPLLAHSEPDRLRAKQVTPPCLYRAVAARAEEETGLKQLFSGVEPLLVPTDTGACLTNIKAQKSVGLILCYVL